MLTTMIKSINDPKTIDPDYTIGRVLKTTRKYPLYYRVITKCGCTYVLNVLFYLHYGYLNPDQFAVHDHAGIIPMAKTATNRDVTDSPYAFIIIRDPVKRFMSLYFDKLYGKPRQVEKFGIGDYFIETGLIDPDAGIDPVKHRDNCIRSIQWIRQNLRGATDQPKNYHWKPQHFKLNQIRRFDFNVIMLEDIRFQLGHILKPLIPEIRQILDKVSARNISEKPVQPEQVLNNELCQLISDTYKRDTQVYREVSTYWNCVKEGSDG